MGCGSAIGFRLEGASGREPRRDVHRSSFGLDSLHVDRLNDVRELPKPVFDHGEWMPVEKFRRLHVSDRRFDIQLQVAFPELVPVIVLVPANGIVLLGSDPLYSVVVDRLVGRKLEPDFDARPVDGRFTLEEDVWFDIGVNYFTSATRRVKSNVPECTVLVESGSNCLVDAVLCQALSIREKDDHWYHRSGDRSRGYRCVERVEVVVELEGMREEFLPLFVPFPLSNHPVAPSNLFGVEVRLLERLLEVRATVDVEFGEPAVDLFLDRGNFRSEHRCAVVFDELANSIEILCPVIGDVPVGVILVVERDSLELMVFDETVELALCCLPGDVCLFANPVDRSRSRDRLCDETDAFTCVEIVSHDLISTIPASTSTPLNYVW